jgi:RHS repeat-associated protein
VLTVSEGSKTLTRVYNAAGRLTSYTDGDGNVIGYQYDTTNRLSVLTYPGGKTVTYTYDTVGRLSTVTDWANRVTTYTYDYDSRVKRLQRPDGSYQTFTFDAAGQLTQMTDLKADQQTVIFSGVYGFDLAGQLTNETLNPALAPTTANVTQTFDPDNRLLTHNESAATFDSNGNLLSIASGVSPASYTYDARNRLISAGGLTYTYNSENRRVALTDSTGTTHFVINPNASLDQVLSKTAPNGTQTFYVYGLGLLNEETNGVPLFYHFDRLGSTVALTSSSGAITGQVSYGSYGEIANQTGTTSTPFLFNGRWGVQTDSNGICFNRARYYHPQLRRFLNQDTVLGSIANSASLNRFAYANGNPISGIDPFGLMQTDPNSAARWDYQIPGFWASLGSGLGQGATDVAAAFRALPEGIGGLAGAASVDFKGTVAGVDDTITTNLANGIILASQTSLADIGRDVVTAGSLYVNDADFRQGVTNGLAGVGTGIALGGAPGAFRSSQPILVEGVLGGGNFGSGGLLQLRPEGGPPIIRFDYHPIPGSGDISIPHIDSPPLGLHHWPWGP